MGKLRSLRRAIERNPESWLYDYDGKSKSYRVKPADRTGKSGWVRWWNYKEKKYDKVFIGPNTFFPTSVETWQFSWWMRRSYFASFVRHVLRGLGYTIRK